MDDIKGHIIDLSRFVYWLSVLFLFLSSIFLIVGIVVTFREGFVIDRINMDMIMLCSGATIGSGGLVYALKSMFSNSWKKHFK